MWIKNIDVKKVENLGFDDRQVEGSYGIVKRVTVTMDVVMLMKHDLYEDPLDRVRANMDGQVWFLRDPIIKAVYQKEIGKAERDPDLPEN